MPADTMELPTEQRLSSTVALDQVSTLELLAMINREDAKVADAVRATLPVLGDVVDRAVVAFRAGATVHYFGAGTSGRFGVLDAAEVPPTYGMPSDRFVAHLAGGSTTMTAAVESAEDDSQAGAREAADEVRAGDVVFGLAASGRTPYVYGALKSARQIGALTIAVSSNPDARIAEVAEHHLYLPTGPEVVTGSTRMKAGTAQKVLLHTFSTALMVRLGRTYSNLMIDVVATNDKLRARVAAILQQISGRSGDEVLRALESANGDAKVAAVMLAAQVSCDEARELLDQSRDMPRQAIKRGVDRYRRTQLTTVERKLHLGVDVGASGYRLAVAGGGEADLVCRQVRPHIDARGLQLDAVLQGLGDDIRLVAAGRPVGSVGVGVAGGAHFTENSELLALTVAGLAGADSAVVIPDWLGGYVGALGLRPGVVLAAGTGAVAVATDLDTRLRRTDGLGHLLGDFGSGAALGQRGLQIATQPEAGRTCESPALRAAMIRRFGGAAELVHRLYGSPDRSALMASFVPDILQAAESGDECASRLVRTAAQELARTLIAAAEGIDGDWAAIGGLVSEGSLVRDYLERFLEAEGHVLSSAGSTPAHGAAELARARAAGELPAVVAAHLIPGTALA